VVAVARLKNATGRFTFDIPESRALLVHFKRNIDQWREPGQIARYHQ